MACYSPLTGYRSLYVNPETGKRPIVFNPSKGFRDIQVKVPCGSCIGCRLEYSRQWAIRCVHESEMHKKNCFITLTYNNDNLPDNRSLDKTVLQKFFKRLRKNTGIRLRHFSCGEYGDYSSRPHYHAIVFGIDFDFDRYIWSVTKSGDNLYRSPMLEKCWPYGFSLIGNVTMQSAAYVARYVVKKRKGDANNVDKYGKRNIDYYRLYDTNTGLEYEVQPEFALMSRGSGRKDNDPLHRYGIGRSWLEKYKADTDKDYITLNGKVMSLPKYYDNVLERYDALDIENRKIKRRLVAEKKAEDNTIDRLEVKEYIKLKQAEMLKRGYENYET